MTKAFDHLPAAIVGKLGEIAAAEIMRSDGASTISLCRIDDGGAPMLERGDVRRDHRILPDLQVFNWRRGGACFIEVKTYERTVRNRRKGVWVHGIPVRQFDHYISNEQLTGLPVYLGVNEIDTGELRISDVPLSKLDRIECTCRGGCDSVHAAKHVPPPTGIKEMQWYFDREDLSIVYEHSKRTIDRLRDEHAKKIRRGHVFRRHGAVREEAPRPCRICGLTTPDMFSVGKLDDVSDRFEMCATCWRSVRTGARRDVRLLRSTGAHCAHRR